MKLKADKNKKIYKKYCTQQETSSCITFACRFHDVQPVLCRICYEQVREPISLHSSSHITAGKYSRRVSIATQKTDLSVYRIHLSYLITI